MDLIQQKVFYNNNWQTIQIPKFCPHCGAVNNPANNVLSFNDVQTSDKTESLLALSHLCNACGKAHYSLEIKVNDRVFKTKIVYPETQPTALPKLVSEHFPNFVTMYNNAVSAEQRGAIELAGMGLRASLEILIKDYALEQKLDDEETIAKQSLNNVIEKYFKDGLMKSADVVRILGNDYAHWRRDYDIPLDEMKAYLDIFISAINVNLMMQNPPVQRNH
ncbi:DUF4145 domain-containing protein [Leuconostoc mesenteroides]|uniref:DUF4145 domain-containing protein n=1 Tax=Leuconostoc mesenteroides TaxID=1245 RepID=UPI00388B36FA